MRSSSWLTTVVYWRVYLTSWLFSPIIVLFNACTNFHTLSILLVFFCFHKVSIRSWKKESEAPDKLAACLFTGFSPLNFELYDSIILNINFYHFNEKYYSTYIWGINYNHVTMDLIQIFTKRYLIQIHYPCKDLLYSYY